MLDPVVALVGALMFAAGFVVGANWRASVGRRARSALALPDERPRRAAGDRR
jgi:hypothetical protein